jgi:hypothetical protein
MERSAEPLLSVRGLSTRLPVADVGHRIVDARVRALEEGT